MKCKGKYKVKERKQTKEIWVNYFLMDCNWLPPKFFPFFFLKSKKLHQREPRRCKSYTRRTHSSKTEGKWIMFMYVCLPIFSTQKMLLNLEKEKHHTVFSNLFSQQPNQLTNQRLIQIWQLLSSPTQEAPLQFKICQRNLSSPITLKQLPCW